MAHDKRAYDKWSRHGSQQPVSDAALEFEVMRIAQLFPGNVIHEGSG